jgi:hypothetical protein
MNINETLRLWIEDQKENYESLIDLPILTGGGDTDIEAPCIIITTTGSAERQDSGVVMYGVSDFTINIELHTLPVSDEDGGTSPYDERQTAIDLYQIIADRNAIDALSNAAFWRIFDIRTEGFNTEASEGRRVTTYPLTVTACPI